MCTPVRTVVRLILIAAALVVGVAGSAVAQQGAPADGE